MKNKVFIFFFLFIAGIANAQTIHWIVFADTKDPENGAEAKNSIEAYTSQFMDRIDDALQAKGYTSRKKIYTGVSFSENSCRNVISNLNCSEKDIVVFYYIGHGGRAQVKDTNSAAYAKAHPWPDLQFNDEGKIKQFMSLNNIHLNLKKKKPRLVLTMGMCCHKEYSNYKPHTTTTQSKKYKLVSKKFAKKFGQKLFLKYKGDIIIASASESQFSYGEYNYSGTELDCFTAAICQTVDSYANNDSGEDATWNSFLGRVATKCTANAKNSGKQTPKYVINVTPAK